MKRFIAIAMIGLFCFALVTGCGKKQEEQPAMEQQQTMPADTMAKPADTMMMTDTSATK